MQIPVLCYHAHILPSADYADNGHAALAADLEMIQSLGRRIVPLHRIVDWLEGRCPDQAIAGGVGLSFDDGTLLDFAPADHPELGLLPGFLPILEDFAARYRDSQPSVHATCFVIASPKARDEADRALLFGKGWLDDSFWRTAECSGRISIENHSWDHNMSIASEAPAEPRDSFSGIDCFELAEHEIARASETIERKTGRRPALFGYPYGDLNSYLRDDYLPRRGTELGLRAAFTTEGVPVTRECNRWAVPRIVHGYHWRDPETLARLLQ
ncbi:MAG: polysaccharide deacetylase family protein [Wenzhouxiangellaceae bacterium]